MAHFSCLANGAATGIKGDAANRAQNSALPGLILPGSAALARSRPRGRDCSHSRGFLWGWGTSATLQ